MTNVPGSIIARIAKLLGLAKSDNINEAAVAAAQAQRLMDEYRLSEVDIAIESDPMQEKAVAGTFFKSLIRWKCDLAMVIAKANGCHVLVRGGSILMLGRTSDVAVAQYFFDFLVREIDRITLKHAKGNGKTYANNFRIGAVLTIDKKLQQDRASQVTGSDATAMVLDRSKNAEAWALNVYKKIGTKASSGSKLVGQAIHDGMIAANEIQLTRGIETTPDSHRLTA